MVARGTILSVLPAAVLVVLGFGAVPRAAAEEAATHGDEEKPGHALCWRGKPECGSFIITEMGVLFRLDDDSPFQGAGTAMATFDLGWMKNLSKRDAVGLTGYAVASDRSRFGIRPRYRRWLSRRSSIDISPGILLSGENEATEYDPPGFVLGASYNLGDLLVLTAEGEYSRYRQYEGSFQQDLGDYRSDTTIRGGAKLGSSLGVAGTAVLFALILYAASTGVFE